MQASKEQARANKIADELLADETKRMQSKAHTAAAKKVKKQKTPPSKTSPLPNQTLEEGDIAKHTAGKPCATFIKAESSADSPDVAPAGVLADSALAKVTQGSKKKQKAGRQALQTQDTLAKQGSKQVASAVGLVHIDEVESNEGTDKIGAVPAQRAQQAAVSQSSMQQNIDAAPQPAQQPGMKGTQQMTDQEDKSKAEDVRLCVQSQNQDKLPSWLSGIQPDCWKSLLWCPLTKVLFTMCNTCIDVMCLFANSTLFLHLTHSIVK